MVKKITVLVWAFFLGSGLFLSGWACAAEPIDLKISHFGPPTWSQQTEALEPWAKRIETLSEGKVKFTFFPKEALGKANEQYDLAIKGAADIACSITEYTPGRFPLTASMTLPFLGVQSGEQASLVFWNTYQKYLQNEFRETKVLWLWCHGPGQIHTINKPVKTLSDLKGLRIRVIDPLMGKVLETVGAIPVACSAPDTYRLMQEGKLDGALVPWEGAYAFNILKLCRYHTLVNFYTMPFFAVMNKEKYESLPEDVRKIIDENSGEIMAAAAGRASDNEDSKGIKLAEDRGDFIYTMPSSELEAWKKQTMTVGDEWISRMKEKGLPGDEVLAYVVDLFIQLQK